MKNVNLYSLEDLYSIAAEFEQNQYIEQEITLAQNIIKAPGFNYLTLPDDCPFINLNDSINEHHANLLEATAAREIVNSLYLDEHREPPDLNTSLGQAFNTTRSDITLLSSNLFVLENEKLSSYSSEEEDDILELLYLAKAEIHKLKEIGLSESELNKSDLEQLRSGIEQSNSKRLTINNAFNLYALESIFHLSKFLLLQETNSQIFGSVEHLLLSQTYAHEAEIEAINYYESQGLKGFRELSTKLDKMRRAALSKQGEKGGKQHPGHLRSFAEMAKEITRDIWLEDIKHRREPERPKRIIALLKKIHHLSGSAENIPTDRTIDSYMAKVRIKMGLPNHKRGANDVPERDYMHLESIQNELRRNPSYKYKSEHP
jgi:rubrerythrin